MTSQEPGFHSTSSGAPLAYFRKRYRGNRSDHVGTVGMARKTVTFRDPTTPDNDRNRSDTAPPERDQSGHSDRAIERSDQKKPSKINVVPTDPTVPTGNDANETKYCRQTPVMPKCAICGTSIPTDCVSGVPVDDGLAHRSCAELGIPSGRRHRCR